MSAASMFPALNALYEGSLCATLLAWKDEGLSLDRMVERIAAEKGVTCSTSTLSRWLSGEECGP